MAKQSTKKKALKSFEPNKQILDPKKMIKLKTKSKQQKNKSWKNEQHKLRVKK